MIDLRVGGLPRRETRRFLGNKVISCEFLQNLATKKAVYIGYEVVVFRMLQTYVTDESFQSPWGLLERSNGHEQAYCRNPSLSPS